MVLVKPLLSLESSDKDFNVTSISKLEITATEDVF